MRWSNFDEIVSLRMSVNLGVCADETLSWSES